MKITDDLTSINFKEVKEIYKEFFNSTNFSNLYSKMAINNFASKKSNDTKKNYGDSKFFFALDNDKIIGFINGTIIDGIGLINHSYIKEEYREKMVFLSLYKKLINWFKENNISIIETEIDHKNPIIDKMEESSWHLYKSFDDANVYQRKI